MDRKELVERVERHIEGRAARMLLSLLLMFSGAAGFGVSLLMLRSGVHSMPIRYAVSGVAAYLAFAVLLRLWIGWRAKRDLNDGEVGDDFPDFTVGDSSSSLRPGHFAGGRSGGGGSSGRWDDPAASRIAGTSSSPSSGSRGGGPDLDIDEDWIWVVMLIAAVLAGAVAIGYVVYAAPALLADLAVDGAIMSTVYRRIAVKDTHHWAATVLRHTWVPALVVIVSLAAGGYALQRLVPEARSIGPALIGIAQRLQP